MEPTTTILIAALAVFAAFSGGLFLARRGAARLKKGTAGAPPSTWQRAPAEEGSSPPAAREPAAGEVEQLTAELRELAGEMEARLDAKLERLQGLLAEAEGVLRRLEERMDSARRSDRPAAECSPQTERDDTAPRDPERQRIVDLYRRGLSIEAIVAEVGLPRGEVELIVNLERHRAI
jgi:hypothetical protein